MSGETKVSGEMQEEATYANISYIYRFSVHNQSIVSCAFAAFGSSSAVFLSALTTGIIVLSTKGTWRKAVKVRRRGGSLRITK